MLDRRSDLFTHFGNIKKDGRKKRGKEEKVSRKENKEEKRRKKGRKSSEMG